MRGGRIGPAWSIFGEGSLNVRQAVQGEAAQSSGPMSMPSDNDEQAKWQPLRPARRLSQAHATTPVRRSPGQAKPPEPKKLLSKKPAGYHNPSSQGGNQ